MRDLVVLLRITQYDFKKEKFLTRYENINVLVGPKKDIDVIKP